MPEDDTPATDDVPATPDAVTPPESAWTKPAVRLRDARSLRAFAHPLRVELITALRVHGPLTATQAATVVDDTPSNCSFHLRTLASFGLIEEIPGADARQRLWRVVRGGVAFEPDDNAESRVAAKAAAQVFHAHTLDSLSRWMDREPDAPQAWRQAWFDSTGTISVTAEELASINARIGEIMRPYLERRRTRDALPDEVPVAITVFGYPQVMPPPAVGATPETDTAPLHGHAPHSTGPHSTDPHSTGPNSTAPESTAPDEDEEV